MVTSNRVVLGLLGILVGALSACASAAPEADPSGAIASSLEGASCKAYPIAVPATPGAEATVRAAFEKLSPGAQITFSPARGTAAIADGLHVPLGSCPRGRDADARARSVIDGARDAFRIDSAEWVTSYAPTCDQIPAEGTTVYWSRATFGGEKVRKDVFSYRLRRAGTLVWMDFASGFYLPPASTALADDMRACAPFDPSSAEASTRSSQLPYQTFFLCAATGEGKYQPEIRDTFELGAEYWEWDESASGALLRRVRDGALRVDPANHTSELIQSNANCAWQGVNHIGFGLRFDAVASKLSESHPGIDCVVCAK